MSWPQEHHHWCTAGCVGEFRRSGRWWGRRRGWMRRSCVPFATVISCGGIIACDRRHFSVARNVRWFRLLHSTLCVCVQSHGVDRNEVVGVKGRRTGGNGKWHKFGMSPYEFTIITGGLGHEHMRMGMGSATRMWMETCVYVYNNGLRAG